LASKDDLDVEIENNLPKITVKAHQDKEVSELASLCHSGLSGIFPGFSEGFPTRFACVNDISLELFITPVVCETLHYLQIMCCPWGIYSLKGKSYIIDINLKD
jgi:hypothetical protein